MNFKDVIANDIETTFMNLDEFNNWHFVNGKKMNVLFDTNELIDRQKRYQYNLSKYSDGMYLTQILIYVKAEDMDNVPPKIGSLLNFDDKDYVVSDVADEMGLYSIELGLNTSVRAKAVIR